MKSLVRLIAIVLCGLLTTAFVPAHAASFGRTTVGATPSSGLRADFKRGSKFVLTEKAVVTDLCAYLDGKGGGTGSQAVRLALYRDRNGVPAEQVLESDEETYFSGVPDEPARWYCLIASKAPLDPGSYWIMIHTGGDPGIIRYFYNGPSNWYGNADTFADGASDTFGTGSTGDGTLSLHVQYLTESEAHFAGPTTVGTRVSSPMSAQQKRGSSFVLTEEAKLTSLNAYVDGQGGSVGTQPLSIGLYTDVNGEPSALVAWGPVYSGSLRAGRTARWVSSFSIAGNTSLMPGRYWIVLHTGGPAGVLRYYMTGTGNWRGSANAGTEPSPLFGTPSSGDGTITANIPYTPTNVLHHTFGRTTPDAIPSGPLSANYIRGADFFPDHSFTEGWVTALWAYMDGNGGASGSQKVQLALYKNMSFEPQMHLVVHSAEVTIPAGMAPGWVRFAIPHTRIFYDESESFGQFNIMMASGGTQGVARYYRSNDSGGWVGAPHGYSSAGPSHTLYRGYEPYPGAIVLMPGNGTPSMYAEFVNTAETD